MDREAEPHPIDYATPPFPERSRGNVAFPRILAMLPLAALVGYAINSGPVFLLAGAASMFAAPLSLVGLLATYRRDPAAWGISFLTNGLSACYFAWLLFVRGLC